MSQTAKKWIKNDAIDGTKILLSNNENLRGRNAAGTSHLNIGKINSSDVWQFGIEPNWGFYPTAGSSLVNKDYVVDVIAGLRDVKDACRLASTSNFPSLSGYGPTLQIDGMFVVDEDRVLLKNQDSKNENGIYVISGVGGSISLTRSTDADDDEEVTQGLAVDIVEGTSYGRTRWLLTTANPITVGVTNLTFVEIPNPSTLVQFKEEQLVLDPTDISNQFVDLANLVETGSLIVYPNEGILQRYSIDFSSSTVGTVTRITFAGDLAAHLVSTDVLIVKYAHYLS